MRSIVLVIPSDSDNERCNSLSIYLSLYVSVQCSAVQWSDGLRLVGWAPRTRTRTRTIMSGMHMREKSREEQNRTE